MVASIGFVLRSLNSITGFINNLCRCWSTRWTWSSTGNVLMVTWSAVCPAVLCFTTSSGHWTRQGALAGGSLSTFTFMCRVVLVIKVTLLRSTEELPVPASILVGHAETLLPLLSLLGLYKDQTPPTASNYYAQQGKRIPQFFSPKTCHTRSVRWWQVKMALLHGWPRWRGHDAIGVTAKRLCNIGVALANTQQSSMEVLTWV